MVLNERMGLLLAVSIYMNSISYVLKMHCFLLSYINRCIKKKVIFCHRKYLFLNNTVNLMALNPVENSVWALNQFVVLLYGN